MRQRWGGCFSGGDVRVGGRPLEEPEPEVFSFAEPLPAWPPGECEWRHILHLFWIGFWHSASAGVRMPLDCSREGEAARDGYRC